MRGIIAVAHTLPVGAWLRFCGFLGKVAHRLAPRLRRQIEDHLTLAYGNEKLPDEIRALTRRVFIMLGKNAGFVIRNFSNDMDNFYRGSMTQGLEHAEKAFQSGRGVIFVTAHLGPFESIAHELSLRGYRPMIVGTPLKDNSLNALLIRNRTRFGAIAIERGKETYRVIKNISNGGTMAILIDQDTKVKSVFVNFFGRPCSTPAGATLLALKTGAAIIPVFSHLNEQGRQNIEYFPEVQMIKTTDAATDVLTNTQTLTTIIENEIRKFPDQWVWMHRRWKTTPAV